MRRSLLLPLLAVVLVGFVKGQNTTEKRIVKYPISGSVEGFAIAVRATPQELKVLDDFQKSKFLEDYHKALLTNDRAALDRMIADNCVWVEERFGKGKIQTKAEFLALFGDEKEVHVYAHERRNAQLRAFGNNTVVWTAPSNSVLKYKGRMSRGPRLGAVVYMKLNGRWQMVFHSIMDYKGLL